MNWSTQNHLASLLKEPFDVEGDLYSLVVKRLSSENGILLPYQEKLPLVDMDDFLNIKVRNNLINLPVSTKEDPIKSLVEQDNELFLQLKITEKSNERQICELLNNLEMTPKENMDCLLNSFFNELQTKMVELLSKGQEKLVAQRLKFWGIEIHRKFDLYCLNYDQLPLLDFGVYNLYNLEQGLEKFYQGVPNSRLFMGNDNYLNRLVQIQEQLKNIRLLEQEFEDLATSGLNNWVVDNGVHELTNRLIVLRQNFIELVEQSDLARKTEILIFLEQLKIAEAEFVATLNNDSITEWERDLKVQQLTNGLLMLRQEIVNLVARELTV